MKNRNLLVLLLFTLFVSCGDGEVNRVLDTTAIVKKSEAKDVTQDDLDNLAEKIQHDIDDINSTDDSDVKFTINRVEVSEEEFVEPTLDENAIVQLPDTEKEGEIEGNSSQNDDDDDDDDDVRMRR